MGAIFNYDGTLAERLLERQGHRAQSIPIGTTAEMLSQVAELNPGVVCISALPPFGVNHARALYTKLRTQSLDLHIVVCLQHIAFRAVKIASGAKQL